MDTLQLFDSRKFGRLRSTKFPIISEFCKSNSPVKVRREVNKVVFPCHILQVKDDSKNHACKQDRSNKQSHVDLARVLDQAIAISLASFGSKKMGMGVSFCKESDAR
jgi:hypothetical protein